MSIIDAMKSFALGQLLGGFKTGKRKKKKVSTESRKDTFVHDHKGRNGIGRRLTAICKICGDPFPIALGFPNQQCGKHVEMKSAPKHDKKKKKKRKGW